MRLRYLVPTALAVAAVAAVPAVGSPVPARADDFYLDESFEVLSITADKSVVKPIGLTPAPVTYTMRTRGLKSYNSAPHPFSKYMTLAHQYGAYSGPQMFVPLKLVSTVKGTSTWRGTMQISGPARTIVLTGVHNCLITDRSPGRCDSFLYPAMVSAPPIRVAARTTPVITHRLVAPQPMSSRTYTLSGRLLASTGLSYGRPQTVMVGRDRECGSFTAGRPVRTKADGTFSVKLPNTAKPARLPRLHCAWLPSAKKDAAGRPTNLARAEWPVEWSYPVQAPTTATLGSKVTVKATARLEDWNSIEIERLEGRSRWLPVGTATVRPGGRVSVSATMDRLGRNTYRLRQTYWNDISTPFVITTTR